MEWKQYAHRRVRGICRVELLECQTLIGESTHTPVASKIMVEGTILLDEDDDVLDVSQFGANGGSGTRGSTSSAASMQKHGRELCCNRSGANFQ
jgi:hypothetical protein